MRPADWGRRLRPSGTEGRVLLVEPDKGLADVLSALFSWHRLGRPDCAATGDEALDQLGSARQRYDLVLMALPLGDEKLIDVTAVLRDNRSPVRLTRYTAFRPAELGDCRRLQGTASVFDLLEWRGIARHAAAVMAAHVSVGTIIERGTVPDTIDADWASPVYRARRGERYKPIQH